MPVRLEGESDRPRWTAIVQEHSHIKYCDGGRTIGSLEAVLLSQRESFARPERLDGGEVVVPSFPYFEEAMARQRAGAATGQDNVPPAWLGTASLLGLHAVNTSIARRKHGSDREVAPPWREGRE